MKLQDACTPDSLAGAFARHGAFPFPVSGMPATPAARQRLDAIVAIARTTLAEPWPALTASSFLRYFRDGNRVGYEVPYFSRRRRIGADALAWAATRDAAFAAAAADGIWMVCEETTWCLPAHFRHNIPAHVASNLPGQGESGFLDLSNNETAHCLAEACQLLGPALDTVDPRIAVRVGEEIRRRVLDPVLAGVNAWWMGGTNNWGPWCASSLIGAASWGYAGDPAAWGRLVHRMLGVVDCYIARQAADGGCDEGTGYWNVAGACVLLAIEEVRSRTGGLIDPWSEPKLKEILLFPSRMHIGNGYFPCFADSSPQLNLARSVLARAAELVSAPELLALARQGYNPSREVDVNGALGGDLLQAQLRELWWVDTAPPAPAHVPADAWLPDLQVMVAHGGGTSLAAKGGHNDENHNHCDVGQFVVHRHTFPLVADAGSGEYTAQTFSPRRYELWWTRGTGHAVPQIDGYEQLPGRDRAARNVRCERDASRASLELDIAACYPAEAGLRTLKRKVELDRRDGVVHMVDRVDAGRPVSYVLPLLVTGEPRTAGDRDWIVESQGQRVRITAASPLAGAVETVALDRALRRNWGALWRITMGATLAPGAEARITVTPV